MGRRERGEGGRREERKKGKEKREECELLLGCYSLFHLTCFFFCSLNLFLPSVKFSAASLFLSSASRSACSFLRSASCCLEKRRADGNGELGSPLLICALTVVSALPPDFLANSFSSQEICRGEKEKGKEGERGERERKIGRRGGGGGGDAGKYMFI